jgi:hypothetical protein
MLTHATLERIVACIPPLGVRAATCSSIATSTSTRHRAVH